MRVTVLGSGTAVPSLRRGSSCYLVETCGRTILVDVGPSAVTRLLLKGRSVDDVDMILLTHFHVDHTAALSTFLFAANYGAVERKNPLLLAGGPGIRVFYRSLRALYPWVRPKAYDLTVQSLAGGEINAGDVIIEARRVNHNRESVAFRVNSAKSVVFSGDTDYSRNLIALASDADLLIAECAFPHTKVRGHLNLATLDRIVTKARPKRVILSHLYPEWDEYRGILRAPMLLAEDGLEIDL